MQLEGAFDHIYSIELSVQLHKLLAYRFPRSDKIHLIQGDSGTVLKDVLKNIDVPVLA